MKVVFVTGIAKDKLLNHLRGLHNDAKTMAVLVSEIPMVIEVYDIETKVKSTGSEALAYLIKNYEEVKPLTEDVE